MFYQFDGFSLDTDTCELRAGGERLAIEPQVFAVLQLLIEARHRLVSRDELVDRVWDGRIVSESAIASRIKSARRAVGDDGEAQRIIRTVPKLGFRFVAEVQTPAAAPASPQEPAPEADLARSPTDRPSIAVLPFTPLGAGQAGVQMAEALPHDLIAELSRLRWLFVIARGSSFRFRGESASIEAVRQALGVRYCLSGTVEIEAKALVVTVELSDTGDGGIVWGERFSGATDAVHEIREEVVQAVISALDLQIPLNEARRARLRSPDNLDAWSAFHLGMHHMYRFSREGAAHALPLFERAISLEPAFARAHAGLSFTHFERAFLGFAESPGAAAAQARRSAEASLDLDPLDPLCNLVMGRAFWLDGSLESSLPWLDRAIRLNPNYAQAKYSRAWAETLLGEGVVGRTNVDAALQLSPLDPLAYGMLGVRAFSHMVLQERAAAATWAERAARAPGAHALIELIAAVAHGLNGEEERARFWAASARRRHPGLGSSDFLKAFPFRDGAMRTTISQTLARL
ncbi:MAG: transcriptional regulator domain protein [Phenylobacterium sp.]|nr:transcriptional regulator domain protein [Phenylobacterium sp.]